MALAKAGADRQVMHERLRQVSLAAWQEIAAGEENLLLKRLVSDVVLAKYLPESELRTLMDARQHLGDAPERARLLASAIREAVGGHR